jgi:NADPH:quinone reductase-like Zn-dependent oxidoreductase
VVAIRELELPLLAPNELLVRVRAASLNMADWYAVAGRPYVGRAAMGLLRPKTERIGTDFAGVVEEVGSEVASFSPGDEVFGARTGAFAEHVVVRQEGAVVQKPANVGFEEAAAVPVAAITALQGLRDLGGLRSGQRVLVNGASGGVGSFGVQVARALGASEVTAVCSTANVETARSLGADHVVDYTRDDFTRAGRLYDLVLDVAGSRPWPDLKRVLEPNGTLVIAGGPKRNRLLGPLGHVVATRLRAIGASRRVAFFIAKFNGPDMETLRELLESGRIRSVVDRTYPLDDAADALGYLGEGHARGKVVLTVPSA